MTPEEREAITQRQAAALLRMDAGHQELLQSLAGLAVEDAFLGSRWSVREVLLHLDAERYIDALEPDRPRRSGNAAALFQPRGSISGRNANTRRPPTGGCGRCWPG